MEIEYKRLTEKEMNTFIDMRIKQLRELRRMIVDNYSVFYTIRADKVIVTDVLYTASDIEVRLRGV